MASLSLRSLEDVLAEELGDLSSAERQAAAILGLIRDAAACEGLRRAAGDQLAMTGLHLRRLEESGDEIGVDLRAGRSEAIGALRLAVERLITQEAGTAEPAARDAALISLAQRLSHYQIAGYGTARSFAMQLGRLRMADRLEECLEEEKQADGDLSGLARSEVNLAAAC
jgi:ferritin-like metal-binding protein YciE